MGKRSSFKEYQKKATEVLKDNKRAQGLIVSARQKLVGVLKDNDKLKGFSEKIYVMVRMVRAQISGEYREFPWRTLSMIVGALVYFVTPLDLIPDLIPMLGLTDDISIVYWIYRSVQGDIEKFESWEKAIVPV